MNRFCWWLADRVSVALEPNERDAVRGDLTEADETGGQALRHILGLVARRQASLWSGWRPWLSLLGVVGPLGMLLNLVARGEAHNSAIYIWMYVNNWDWQMAGNAGFWRMFAQYAGTILLGYAALACWSWASGFVLGSLSRRTVRLNAILFCLVLFLLGPHSSAQPPGSVNAPVFSLAFYRVVYPLLVQVVMVFLPLLWGIRQGLRPASIRLPQTIAWAVAISVVTIAASVRIDMWTLPAFRPLIPMPLRWSPVRWVPPAVLLWPVVYMLAIAARARRRTNGSATA